MFNRGDFLLKPWTLPYSSQTFSYANIRIIIQIYMYNNILAIFVATLELFIPQISTHTQRSYQAEIIYIQATCF